MRLAAGNLRNPPVTAFVFGIPIRGAVEADTVEGWVECMQKTPDGSWMVENDEIKTERIYGNVSIRWDRIAPGWEPGKGPRIRTA